MQHEVNYLVNGESRRVIQEEAPAAETAQPAVPVVETKTYPDGTQATGPAPLPEESPAQEPPPPAEATGIVATIAGMLGFGS